MKLQVALLVLPFAAACSPPVCDPISNAAQAVCHRADAGTSPCPEGYSLQDGQCVSTSFIKPRGCASGSAPLLALLGIATLLRRRRGSSRA